MTICVLTELEFILGSRVIFVVGLFDSVPV